MLGKYEIVYCQPSCLTKLTSFGILGNYGVGHNIRIAQTYSLCVVKGD